MQDAQPFQELEFVSRNKIMVAVAILRKHSVMIVEYEVTGCGYRIMNFMLFISIVSAILSISWLRSCRPFFAMYQSYHPVTYRDFMYQQGKKTFTYRLIRHVSSDIWFHGFFPSRTRMYTDNSTFKINNSMEK